MSFFRVATLLVAAILLSGCSALAVRNWSYAGLTFTGNYRDLSKSFSGVPATTPAQMPTNGKATYNGEYKYFTYANPLGGGNAQVSVDFAAKGVQLSLTGDFNGTSSGYFTGDGTQFGSDGTGFLFNGQFYGANATLAAGLFWTGSGSIKSGAGSFITSQ